MYSFVDTTNTSTHAVLNIPGQLHAFFHVLTLNKFKHDIALRRLWIKSGIGLPIILFHRNNGVLTHSHIQIVLSPVHTQDRKSTRLNSSHANISYAVFCLKKYKHLLANVLTLITR